MSNLHHAQYQQFHPLKKQIHENNILPGMIMETGDPRQPSISMQVTSNDKVVGLFHRLSCHTNSIHTLINMQLLLSKNCPLDIFFKPVMIAINLFALWEHVFILQEDHGLN